jgi:signal transduction histidine kinase
VDARGLFSGTAVLDRQRLGIVVRGVLLLLCSGLSVVETVRPSSDPGTTLGRLVALMSISLVAIVALAAWPSARWVPVVESAAVALLVMSDGGPHQSLLPYLLAPAIDAGLLGGISTVIYAAGASSSAILLARILGFTDRDVLSYSTTGAEWVMLALLAGALAAWARRLGVRTAGRDEAYPAAFRLVSQLRTVARHLSGGLDAVALGETLLQQLKPLTSYDRAAVFVPGPAGSPIPLASDGHAPDWNISLAGDNVVAEAWSHQRPVLALRGLNGTPGMVSMALPLIVGARTTGMVALERRGVWDGSPPDELGHLVEDAALRIETALLFSEVRAIATAEERKRLAREIHDGIAQELAFLGYVLDDLSARSDQPDVQSELKDLRGQVTRVVGDLRLSIFELRSEVDRQAGLGSAVSDFVRSVGTATSMTVHLQLDESPQRLSVGTEAELLRIAQESINNARKHADAENLWVTVSVHPPRAQLIVEDDGHGMGPGRHDSYGLQIMRERATSLGATLFISERAGGGTRVEVGVGAPTPENTRDEHEVSERP